MRKNIYRESASVINKAIAVVLICTMGLVFCWSVESLAASAKDSEKQQVAPSATEKPGQTAPSPTASPPLPTATKKLDLSSFKKDVESSHFTISPTNFETGDYIRYSFKIHHQGNVVLAQVPYVIYFLKRGQVFCELDRSTVNNLQPGTQQTIEKERPITYQTCMSTLNPILPGEYRGAVILELNPSWYWGQHPPAVLGEGVKMTEATFRRRYVDLVVSEFSVIGSPPQRVGEYFEVEYTIKNKGDIVSTQLSNLIKCRLIGDLSAGRDFGTQEHRFTVQPLLPNQTVRGRHRFQMPNPPDLTELGFSENAPVGFDVHISLSVTTQPHLWEINELNNSSLLKARITARGGDGRLIEWVTTRSIKE